jgi:hypothetical protein
MPLSFEELVAEGSAAPVEGWNFSWFDGRATEERPPWGYAKLMAARMARADVAVDLQTGGGEVLAGVADPPRLLVATESWPPNLRVAQSNLRPLGAHVVAAADRGPLPFRGRDVRPRREPPSGHDALGRDRADPQPRRDVPVPRGRRRLGA